jgi:hypothetical protein
MWVCIASGCGGRTLAGIDDTDAGDANPGASGAMDGSSGSASGSAVGGSGGEPFYVCPPVAPEVESTCDSPERICVYPTFDGCQSFVCSPSQGWQPSQQGC